METKDLIDAIRYCVTQKRIKTSDLQKKFCKGYHWAERIISEMERLKVVDGYEYLVSRKVIVTSQEAEEIIKKLQHNEN